MDEAVKVQLVERFRAYLDSTDTPAAEPPAGDPAAVAGQAPDLFTLLAELAALKTEVKGESRQLKTALEQFRSLFDTLQQSNGRLAQELEHSRETARREQAADEQDLLLDLLDLHDRLQAGLDQARRYRPGWLARQGGAAGFVAAMAEGVALNLARLDAILARRAVRPLPAVGRRFDPLSMQAADVANDPGRADGEVLGELRRGYLRDDRLLRPAEVIVNRNGAQSNDEESLP